jgi:hydroxymethylpyrimidine pyrophosphatase-like HAD family hydrolase
MVDYIDTEGPAGRDGFLATNSLLGSTLLISRAYNEVYEDKKLDLRGMWRLGTDNQPWSQWLEDAERLWRRDTLIVLCGGATSCGAVDLESKFTEAALGHVQVADYRNFAHGRHHWLAKRSATSAVVAFTTDEDRGLATRTLALLPKSVPVLRADFPGGFFETSILSLLLALRLVGSAGAARGIDPGRPGVPEFGRRLFGLRTARARGASAESTLREDDSAAIERKTGVTIDVLNRRGDLASWRNALAGFKNQLCAARYYGAVFDYDGTLVDSKDRFDPPRTELIAQIVRLLKSGFIIGIATGRGPSVRRDLQPCIPPNLRPNVVVGYYNGAEVSTLDDDLSPDNRPVLSRVLKSFGATLRNHSELQAIATQEDRRHQITLEQKYSVPEDRLWDLVNQLAQTAGPRGVSVVRSSHSIDILAPSVSKTAVLDRVNAMRPERVEAQILKVGDRGRWPGNDFALLRGPYSLSVDEVSVDPGTCWNLSPRGVGGSEAALRHLVALRRDRGSCTWRYDVTEG